MKKGLLYILKHKSFVKNITGVGTDSTKKVKKSDEIFKKIFVKRYLGDPDNISRRERTITGSKKELLFDNIPYCCLCYGKLKSVKETHSEHIKAFIKGSEGQLLAHPDCNRSKLAKDIEQFRRLPKHIRKRFRNKKNIDDFLDKLKDFHKHYPKNINKNLFRKLIKFAKSDKKLKV